VTTLLALFSRPDGGAPARAKFERPYPAPHHPQVAATPGLRATRVRRVTASLTGESEFVIATEMDFDDRAALDAGLGSDAMRAGARNLREIAPGLLTLLVLEPFEGDGG
jgi:uncharacterized protein (TIGR02118 family)